MAARYYKRRPARQKQSLPGGIFEQIVQRVPTTAAAERYGLQLNRHGLCCCPFHTEKTASFKVYPGTKGYYCFGCGSGGNVITFTKKLFGLSALDAAKKLDVDFSLGLFSVSKEERKQHAAANVRLQLKQAEQKKAAEDREAALWAISNELREIYSLPKPKSGEDSNAALYGLKLARAEYLEYAKEELLAGKK